MQIVNRRLICLVGGKYVAYHKGSLLLSKDFQHFEHLCTIPMPLGQRVLASFSLSARLFRMFPRAVYVLDDNTFIFGFSGRIFFVDVSKKAISIEHKFPVPMNSPLAFTKVDGISGFDDCVLYGEYHANPQKNDMGIFARYDGEWKKVYTFPADQILHIHGFCTDKSNDRVLILTGDTDKESAIYEARNNFTEVRPLLIGCQKYRSCVAFSGEDFVVYATDTPLEPNAIYQYHNGAVEKVYNMPGPSIFGTEIEKDGEKQFVFATSVEPDSRIKGKRYWVTNKIGPGVKERYCHIVVGNMRKGFRTIIKLKKDWLPMTAFQFGNASFTSGVKESLFILPQSVRRYNNKTIIINDI